MIEVMRALAVGGGLSEYGASGVQKRTGSSDVIALKLQGALRSKRLMMLGVEYSITGHLQGFWRLASG